ncbi:hypothetical protein, variant [Saprolegnia diclina VS20]|uniref:ABC transporter domain-containing protein n=1 Tax=Saprolegnia diclina (strain VS20) TaxID=1156394 RepID=T0Q849_SAPDV|nr:hypothetical protein, variant [Saprolegnia diclina VS20]EQC30806.1 hypothetical protein, variant [Saprolegnia diclina VS20]|eukprot:XP_008615830.1 hypothetical protein, variant [Saprolegnia diclina VS20]
MLLESPVATSFKEGLLTPTWHEAAQPCTLGWSHLSYTVTTRNKPKSILVDVSGRCGPREMLAILGPSGSGKTTLLDLLADRISSGKTTGAIEINGEPRDHRSFRSLASYVAQEDALLGSFTVLETLRFAAQLSLPSSVSASTRETRVLAAIEDMGLSSCVGTRVGDIFRKGLSGGQKRRLSIAIELLEPTILLLDEPTSGLDAASTVSVVEHLRHISTDRGCTVLCTIHQPSSDVYDLFTSVLVLAAGRTMYFGPPLGALSHFAAAGYPCPPMTNPAEFYLELVNDDFDGHADVLALASAYDPRPVLDMLEMDRASLLGITASDDGASAFAQGLALLHRTSINNVRDPGVYWVRLAMYTALSLTTGTLFISTNANLNEGNRVALLIYVQAFLVFMSIAVLPVFIQQRAVFARERANHNVAVASAVGANFVAALPGIFLITLLSASIVVLLADLHNFGYFVLNLFLTLVVAESFMHVIGAMVPQYIVGIALASGIYGMFMLCEGFMVPRPAMPSYWLWGHYMAFHSYSFEAFLYKQLTPTNSSESRFLFARYGLEDVDCDRNMLVLASYALALQGIYLGILHRFHTGRR